jgi:hypothetical protein
MQKTKNSMKQKKSYAHTWNFSIDGKKQNFHIGNCKTNMVRSEKNERQASAARKTRNFFPIFAGIVAGR